MKGILPLGGRGGAECLAFFLFLFQSDWLILVHLPRPSGGGREMDKKGETYTGVMGWRGGYQTRIPQRLLS